MPARTRPSEEGAAESHDETLLLDQELEDRFFRGLLEHPGLAPLVLPALNGGNFSTRVKSHLFEVVKATYTAYGQILPRDALNLELEERVGHQSAALVRRYFDRLDEIPVPDWDWIITRIDDWIRRIQLHKAIYSASQNLLAGKRGLAEEEILSTIRRGGITSGGAVNDLKMDEDGILQIVTEDNLFCTPTRIYALDHIIRGLYRQEVFVVIAPLNVGKSWSAQHLCVSSLMTGRHVLYLTLEMNRQRVLQRLFQNMSGMVRPRHANDMGREIEIWDEEFSEKELVRTASLLNVSRLQRNIRNLASLRGTLAVRHYPSGTCTLSNIEREVAVFDAEFSHPPDVLIVDGLPDLDLQTGSDDRRRQIGFANAVRDLRRMASEHNAAVVCTHQTNRTGLVTDLVEAQHTGESLGIVQVADTAISLNQTRKENALGTMRVFVMRARNQRKGGLIEVYQNLDIGQFCQVSRIVPFDEQEDDDNDTGSGDTTAPGGDTRERLRRKRTRRG